ncbi:hypothetical protein [Chromobacterium haemolyticum]|uniref:hypothetical protein n=1 Tax=Chromobacterium haemolyticum TaxID=394935 RepID=UPI0015933161|nr:hypothetical protein [Chromobacterium haemolyticum]
MKLLTAPQLERFNKQFDARTYISDQTVSLDFIRGVQHVVDMVNALSRDEEEED